MDHKGTMARVFRVREEEALSVTETPFGKVGQIHSGEGIDAVWVSKQDEAIDPDWFSQSSVDVIIVLQGKLRIVFESDQETDRTLGPGDVLILPAQMRCRAYRWPRECKIPSVFLAVYPKPG